MSIESSKGGAPCAAAIIDGTRSAQAALNNTALIMREVRAGERDFDVDTANKIVKKLETVINAVRNIEELARHDGVSEFGKPKG